MTTSNVKAKPATDLQLMTEYDRLNALLGTCGRSREYATDRATYEWKLATVQSEAIKRGLLKGRVSA